jgi:hypothetical protein
MRLPIIYNYILSFLQLVTILLNLLLFLPLWCNYKIAHPSYIHLVEKLIATRLLQGMLSIYNLYS